MTKKTLVALGAAGAQVQQAIDLLEKTQETLVEDSTLDFPVGIIFSAQTSLRVVAELLNDVQEEHAPKKKTAKKAAKAKKAR